MIAVMEKPYAEFVAEQFAAAKSDAKKAVGFTNRGSSNAKIVLRHLITAATSKVEIFTGCLSLAIYDPDWVRATALRLGPEKMRIIVADPMPFSEPSALSVLNPEIREGLIRVRTYPVDKGKSMLTLDHFALVDGQDIRVETNHEQKTAAIVLNADPETSAQYQNQFKALWLHSVPWTGTQA